jgi:glycosyltransferase involved in cell wall biosynthesis
MAIPWVIANAKGIQGMGPLVSVIVPVYNVEKYLDRCLDSIINQTYSDIEIIVVNDGSTDNSYSIICEYQRKDERIKLINQKNKGLSAARNIGIQNCCGEYVFFVDSDDIIAYKTIESFMNVAKASGADYVCSESFNFSDEDEEAAWRHINNIVPERNDYIIFDNNDLIKGMFYQRPSITGAYLKLYKYNLFDNITFPEGHYYEDFATTFRFILEAKCIAFISERYYGYRIRNGSIMSQPFNRRKLDCLWITDLLEKEFASSEEEMLNAVSCGIFRINRIVYSQISLDNLDESRVFDVIKKYRKNVLINKNVKAYERVLALSSYMGKHIFKCTLWGFGVMRLARIRRQVV